MKGDRVFIVNTASCKANEYTATIVMSLKNGGNNRQYQSYDIIIYGAKYRNVCVYIHYKQTSVQAGAC